MSVQLVLGVLYLVCFCHKIGYHGQPTTQQPSCPSAPADLYPVGQQMPNQSANLDAAPPDYEAGKYIVRSRCMQNWSLYSVT